jgi:hypothetical protein
MGETVDDDTTTWCDDSDSCASASKCYCTLHDRKSRKKKGNTNNNSNNNNNNINKINNDDGKTNDGTKKNKSNRARKGDNLALDYELFTVSGSQRHVKPTEALSVKKSVEMAALFADVKLSQTTDITSLQPPKDGKAHKSKHHHKKHSNSNNNNNNHHHNNNNNVLEGNKNFLNPKHNSNNDNIDYYKSSDVVLRKDLDLSSKRAAANGKSSDGYYQPIAPRPVSASLEDSLGYLP